jgi:hypothetical protein
MDTASVKIRFCYLRSGTTTDFQFNREERDEMKWRIGEDFALLQEKSEDPVVNIAPLASFPARIGAHCLQCSHQVLCNEFTDALARGAFDSNLK